MKKIKPTNYKTLDQERQSIQYLTKKKEDVETQIKINQILKDNNIRTLDDIDRMTPSNDKELLTYNGNEPNTSYNFYVPFLLPKIPTKIVEIKHKDINQGELFKIAVLDGTTEKLERFNIETPTEEQLSHTRYNVSVDIDYEYINSIPENSRLVEIQKLRKEQADKITHTEAINIYYKNEIHLFNEETKKEYVKNLSRQEVHVHYQRNIDKLYEDLEQISNLIFQIQENLKHNETLKHKGQPTYKTTFYAAKEKQKGKISELNRKQEEIKLLEDLIYSDPTLSKEEKKDALENVKLENVEYEIDRWLGKKLNRHERRILRVLRCIIYQLIEQDEITGYGKSCYEAEIPLARIYNEYGLTPRSTGSYQHNQTKLIQDILFGSSSSGLHKDILFNHHGIQKTRYILQLEEIKQKVKIKTKEVEQRIGIRILVPSFLFVSNLKLKNFYYQDTEGLRRFMSIKGMGNSNAAFNIFEYCELHFLFGKKVIEFNLDKLIKEAELEPRYKKNRQETIDTLETIFNNMVKANCLIKSWKIEKGKYSQEKYVFENSRYELFTKNKKIAEIRNLPTASKK